MEDGLVHGRLYPDLSTSTFSDAITVCFGNVITDCKGEGCDVPAVIWCSWCRGGPRNYFFSGVGGMSRLGCGLPSFDITSDIPRILYHIYDITLTFLTLLFS